MSDEINYQSNPLHGVSLKTLLTELVDQYGYEILFAYLNINCFRTNPSIESSVKFLKKTTWAREKVESFYLYQFKSLPRASAEQFELPPRMRVIPEGIVPGEPAELSLEDAARLHAKRAKKAAGFGRRPGGRGAQPQRNRAPRKDSSAEQRTRPAKPPRHSSTRPDADASSASVDPWANWKKTQK